MVFGKNNYDLGQIHHPHHIDDSQETINQAVDCKDWEASLTTRFFGLDLLTSP